MKYSIVLIPLLIIAGIIVSGCQSTAPAAPLTRVPTPAVTPVATTATQQSFTLGNHYLEKKYSFYSEKDLFTEEIRVPNGQPRGVEFHVLPTNENLQYCWFELLKLTNMLTNMDTGHTETFG